MMYFIDEYYKDNPKYIAKFTQEQIFEMEDLVRLWDGHIDEENAKSMTNEELIEKYNKDDAESSEVLKDAEPTWQDELQWYADEMKVVANELETRGIEIKNKWWE